MKSLEFSNQYYSSGANAWGSPQVGIDVSGNVNIEKISWTLIMGNYLSPEMYLHFLKNIN